MNIGEHCTEDKAAVGAEMFESGDGLVDILGENCIYGVGKRGNKGGAGGNVSFSDLREVQGSSSFKGEGFAEGTGYRKSYVRGPGGSERSR